MKSHPSLLLLTCLSVGLLAACQAAPPTGNISAQPSVSADPVASPRPVPSTAPPSPAVEPSPSVGPSVTPSVTPTNAPPLLVPAHLASIRFSPDSPRFFTAAGETASLQIELRDAAGQPVSGSAPLEWTSSRPDDFGVDATGRVTALRDQGFSEIGVRVAGTDLRARLLLSVSSNDSGGGGGSSGGDSSAPITVRSVSAITPARATVGTQVVIRGEGFTGTGAVAFNGVPATDFTVDNNRQITAMVPVGATDGPVTVFNGQTRSIPFDVIRIVYVDADATSGGNTGASWSEAFTDLQSALATAEDDQIWIAEGRYVPGTSAGSSFQLTPGVALYGGFAGNESTLDARDIANNVVVLSGDVLGNDDYTTLPGSNREDNVYHVVTGAEGAHLDGLRISHGSTITSGPGPSEDRSGGGLVSSVASLSLRQVIIEHNTGGSAAGMRLKGSLAVPAGLTLDQVVLRENYSLSQGAGLTAEFATLTINASQFVGNVSGGQGGGMSLQSTTTLNLTDVQFIDNTAEIGGAMASGGLDEDALLERVVFLRNHATDRAGALFNSSSSPTLRNVVFANNSAVAQAGAIESSGDSSPRLTHVTFSQNTAPFCGGICNIGSANVILVNTLFWESEVGSTDPSASPIELVDGNVIAMSDPFVDAALPLGSDEVPGVDDGLRIASDATEVIGMGVNRSGAPARDILNLDRVGNREPGAYELIP
ncbi:MAG: hypothetical protein ACO1RX_19960 [Candidatus Sericytochromatia bacterium]